MSSQRRPSEVRTTKPRTATFQDPQPPGEPVTGARDSRPPVSFAKSCNAPYSPECPFSMTHCSPFLPPGSAPFHQGTALHGPGMHPTVAGAPCALPGGTPFAYPSSYPFPTATTHLFSEQPSLTPNVTFIPSSQGGSSPIVLPFPMPMPMPSPSPAPPAPAPFVYAPPPPPPPPAPAQDMSMIMLLMNQMRAQAPGYHRWSEESSSEEERRKKKKREKEKEKKKRAKEREKEKKKKEKEKALAQKVKAREKKKAEQARKLEEVRKAAEERKAEEVKKERTTTWAEYETAAKSMAEQEYGEEQDEQMYGEEQEEAEEPILAEEPVREAPAPDIGFHMGGARGAPFVIEPKGRGRCRCCCLCCIGLAVVGAVTLAAIFVMFPDTLQKVKGVLGINKNSTKLSRATTTAFTAKYLREDGEHGISTRHKISAEEDNSPDVKQPGWIPETIVLVATTLEGFHRENATTMSVEGSGVAELPSSAFQQAWNRTMKEPLVKDAHFQDPVNVVGFGIDAEKQEHNFHSQGSYPVQKGAAAISYRSGNAGPTKDIPPIHDSKPRISLGLPDDEISDFRRRLSLLLHSTTKKPVLVESKTRSVIEELLAEANQQRTTTAEVSREFTYKGDFRSDDDVFHRQQMTEDDDDPSVLQDTPMVPLPRGYVTLEHYRIPIGPPRTGRFNAILRRAIKEVKELRGNNFNDAIMNISVYTS